MEPTENFSHPVKANTLELHYTHQNSVVTIHKAGCKHAAESKSEFDIETVLTDDFYHVAPCARKS